jgi:DNA/RNA endonuclease G (NUC1)
MKRVLLSMIVTLCVTLSLSAQENVQITNQVFQVIYSQQLQQPIELTYHSINRPTKVNRGAMDFYTEKGIITSDGADYKTNVYDKGHLAPAATFSDNMENLKQTFSYLNCALQDQYMNRGEWRLLEEQERKWDDVEPLTIKVELIFGPKSIKLSSGATVPTVMVKHIYFDKSKKWRCFSFPNTKPTKPWEEHEVKHKH